TPDSQHSVDFILEDRPTTVQTYIEELRNTLDASLPSYMVPTKWIAVKNIPLNASGKLNRKQVETWLHNMDEHVYARLSEFDNFSVCREPQTRPERVLVNACCRVLNVQACQVNIDRSFVANGGDSISAMRLTPQCRAENVVFSVATLLKAKSLAEVAKLSSVTTRSTLTKTEDFGRPFPLSPIQQWFFDQTPSHLVNYPSHYCNQSFYVRINQPVSSTDVADAVSKVVEQHSMLRVRFQQQHGNWTQIIPEFTDAAYHFEASSLNSMEELQTLASRRQLSLDFQLGLVFSADLCTFCSGEQYLVLVAHHLVIDLVSWRIILDDLETLLTGGVLMESLPFRIWNDLQRQEAKSSKFHSRNVLSTDGINNDLGFWKFQPGSPNSTRDHINKSFTINQETTSLALKEANNAFNTEPVDLLLSAVWDAFFSTFISRHSLTIFNEGHGREPWNADIDISRTVGWFTTMSPINMSRENINDRIDIVRRIKDARRKLPANGWKYFSSRYLNSEGIDAFKSHESVMEMSFNYHGQFQQLEREDSFFTSIELPDVSDIGPELPASSLFNVNMSIEGGETHVSFAWNRHISHQHLIIRWIEQIGPSLQSICDTLVSRSRQKTLTDYEFLSLDYASLDHLQSRIIPEIERLQKTTVQDIYPCSPMVEGILLSQAKEGGLYETSQIYEIRPRGKHIIDMDRLQAAWQNTISCHPSLRSLFIESLDPSFAFNQVVLEKHYGEVVVLTSDTLRSAEALLQVLPKVNYQQLKPPHRLTLCQILDAGTILCQIEMSHTITDGASTGILIDDWAQAYKRMLRKANQDETCREFARALVSGDAENKKLYWKKKLAGLKPCLFPPLDKNTAPTQAVSWSTVDIDGVLFASMQKFCESHSITPSSLFHAAWALTLATYTGTDSVCFGYIASGRDLPITGLVDAVGAFANIMVCRANISRDWSKQRFVQYLHHQVLEDMGYQHCSLADIQHDLGIVSGHQLFNTIMSFQKEIEQYTEDAIDESLDFIEADGDDPTEYDVAISITWGVGLARLFINCHPSRFTNDQCHRILTSFKTITTNLVRDEHSQVDVNTLQNFNMINKLDLQDIWKWNAEVPETVDTCLHDLIVDVARKQPQDIAVNAWDGDWTYGKLDSHSTQIAQHLTQLGVRTGDVVALYFERSGWVSVAMLAVLKAGGVATLMDSSQSENVLLQTMEQCKPALLLSSDTTKALVGKLTDRPILVVNNDLVGPIARIHPSTLPRLEASAQACLIFSRGSTGPPKCVALTHSHLSTAAKHQKDIQGYHAESRVYDFMPYASQIAWKVFAYTFTSGACLCVPSKSEQQHDLDHSILHWRPTILDITPSLAVMLSDDVIQSLKTLIVGGEHLSSFNAKRWARLVDLKFTYGLLECTPVATVGTVRLEEDNDPTIGKGAGVNTWITNIQDSNTLAPIGSIGELVLEGSLIGARYLDNNEKISASIIENPLWLAQGSGDPNQPGRTGRLFRTGDLVRYNKDGTLKFIARKENLAKVHEQHVELGEVEDHMRRVPSISHAVCLIPKSGRYSDKLVGIFSLDESFDNGGTEHRKQTTPELISRDKADDVRDCIQSLQAALDNAMPAYMVPGVWVPLRSIPITHSGALDRKLLANWLCDLDEETNARISNAASSSSEPVTMSETVIRDACSHVLNVPPNLINMQRSFIANGGDSISAMQISPYCRAAGVVVPVASLLRAKKLVDVAASANIAKGALKMSYKEDFGQAFSLSPIQQWFFNQSPSDKVNTADYYCNQAFYVQIKRHVLSDKVAEAIDKIVQQHSMLRARFQLDARTRGWAQLIPRPEDAVYKFATLPVDSLATMKSIITQRHQQLDIERGLVFSVDMFSLPSGEQFLALIAHHLVVDLVSWRIILDDLETLLGGGTIIEEMPFQSWQNLQAQEARSSTFLPEKVLPCSIQQDLDFWNYSSATPNTFNDHFEHSFDVDSATTAILLEEANKAFNTEPVDLILASVWDSFFHTFKTRQGLTIFNEGHGREPWAPELDISRTVGWFTTMTPIHISRDHTTTNIPRFVKDIRKQLPSNGWAYFTSRYLNSEGMKSFESHDTVMEVLFNYHGQFQQLESEDALFENVVFEDIFDAGDSLPTSALFSINVSIERGLTRFTFSWNKHINHQNLIRDWMAQVVTSMQTICSSLSALQPTPTLVDHEFLSLDYKGLDELQNHILPAVVSETGSSVSEVYPCLPMVDGMLLSQIRDPEAYKTLHAYEMRHHPGQRPLDVNQLAEAWQAVIARHPALRSVFFGGVGKTTAFSQVILESYHGEVIVLEAKTKIEAVALIRQLPAVDYQQLKPPHRLVLCRTLDDGAIICQIEMSHTIVDGASTSILLGDWSKAYSNSLDTKTLSETNRNVVRALQNNSLLTKMAYWKQKLSGVEQCHFPKLADASAPYNDVDTATASVDLDGDDFNSIRNFCISQSVTPASIFQSAWALLLSIYTGNSSVCFGYIASGRDLPVDGIEQSVNAYANMLICRSNVSRTLTSYQFIQELHDQVLEDLDFQHCSLADIQHDLQFSSENPLFNTILSFQKDGADDAKDINIGDLIFVDMDHEDPIEYDISFDITYGTRQLTLSLDYRMSCLTPAQAKGVLSMLETIIASMVGDKTMSNSLAAIETVSQADLEQIWNWNSSVPETVEYLVHDMITKTARQFPNSTAICAWDGNWSYEELDVVSTKLAYKLVALGVSTGKVVPLCFEKSRWMPVAMLAVMKAGGTSVSLDSSLPEERLRIILQQVRPVIVLSSSSNAEMTKRLTTSPIFLVDEASAARLESVPTTVKVSSNITPRNILYIVFTSGSTGTPKGVKISHSNFASALYHQRRVLAFEAGARIYDFASYAFDTSWQNILGALECGACLCTPSNFERQNDLAGSLERYNISRAELTPSAAQLLPLSTIKNLSTLILGGESLSPTLAEHWSSVVDVRNSYGPCECTPTTTMTSMDPSTVGVASIGRGCGANTWVVSATGDSLAPIGSIGELYIEGPLVGPGYLDDEERTAACFIESPPWLLRGSATHSGRRGRLYKTGDLVRYDLSGNLIFIGRKDDQVKINGQRLELGDVEFYVGSAIVSIENVQVVAEVVKPKDSDKRVLTVFLCVKDASANLDKLVDGVADRLTDKVPAYMIPSAYILLQDIPMTSSGKTDRRALRAIAEQLTRVELMAHGSARAETVAPKTPTEIHLQELWSTILGIPQKNIGANDSFLRIGGDSIGAMKLAALARDSGFSLTVTDIFRHPCLRDLAQVARKAPEYLKKSVVTFSLLPGKVEVSDVRSRAAQICGISPALIQDAFPCTPLQEGLLALTSRRSGDYVAQNTFQLQANVDIPRFQRAWEHVIATTPILRTRIVDLDTQGLVQLVIEEEPAAWPESITSTLVYQETDRKLGMGLGTPLMRYAITRDSHDHHMFIWTVHHALYDGWSMPLILQRLEMAYNGDVLPTPPPFQDFVRFIGHIDVEDAERFWASQFEKMHAHPFPSLPSPVYQPRSDAGVSYHVEQLPWPKTDTTPSTAIRAALSILIATYCDGSEALFGATITGRQAPVPGVESMTGPTIATVPVRVTLDKQQTVGDFLQQIQAQAIDVTAFEQTGLQRIRRITAAAKKACEFQTLLLIHPIEEPDNSSSLLFVDAEEFDESADDSFADFDTHAITLECDLEKAGALLRFRFDSHVIDKVQVEKLACQLDAVLRQLCDPNKSQVKLSDVDVVSSADLTDIWGWNATVPQSVDRVVHDLIAEIAFEQPKSTAVCAWDGDWTYQELDSIATRVAHRLVSLGVGPDVIVPICFEKSRWMPVAMLAVMKAGGASVALDTTLPEDRLRSILRQVDPSLVLSSSSSRSLAESLSDQPILILSDKDQEAFADEDPQILPTVSPSNKLYLVFTSGSTGIPKGAIVTHSNFSSAIYHQQAVTGFRKSSRVYDLAKYAFDISWSNFIHTLAAGGCLCIPSQRDSVENIASSIRSLNANFVDITPSVASTLQPSDLSSVKTVVFAGEALTSRQAAMWSKQARVLNMYGPAECTVKATLARLDDGANSSLSFPAASIGRGVGACTWIVDPSNHHKLVPVGAVGELVLEGPIVGSGYIGDAEKTAAAFVQDPAWLLLGGPGYPGRTGRVYKTGDLVQYDADGCLTFIGRKDSQIKINGQRLELGDVEYNLASSLDNGQAVQLAAEVITPRDSSKPILVAFIQSSRQPGDGGSDLRSLTAGLNDRLASRVPAYMIPSGYIMIDKLPISATGKLDRKQLRAMGAELDLSELKDCTATPSERRPPSTAMELCLRELWASTLGVGVNSLYADDTFFSIGGDSIQAMRLSMQARHQGLHIAVADILMYPTLWQMSLKVQDEGSASPAVEYEKFSLLPPGSRPEVEKILVDHGIAMDNVQDILPVTDQQARYLLGTYTQARSAVYYHTLDRDDQLNWVRLRAACASLVERLDMMRAVFIAYKDMFLQAVLARADIDIGLFETATNSLDEYTLKLKQQDLLGNLSFGKPVAKISIVHQTQELKYRIVIRLSHAQYDGTALSKMWAVFDDAYSSGHAHADLGNAETDFSRYMNILSLMDQKKATEYWQKMLQGSVRTVIKRQTTHRLAYALGPTIVKTIPASDLQSDDFTFATVLKAAWAYVLARYSAMEDIVFGSLVHGRNEPGTQGVFGSCVNIVPTRIRFQNNWSIRDLIAAVNHQQAEGMPFETMGSRDIIRHCTSWPKWAYFSSVIVHQNYEGRPDEESSTVDFDSADLSTGDIDSVQVYITSTPGPASTEIHMGFTDNVIPHPMAHQLASDLEDTIKRFYSSTDASIMSPREIQNLPALLPLPADEADDAAMAPTQEQIKVLRQCPDKLRHVLGAAWKDVLKVHSVPSDESLATFFELGGDADNAGQLAAHMQRQGYSVRIEDVFENPTWFGLLLRAHELSVEEGVRI
ncbi:NRPS protein, partial [Claviceps africana]